MNYMFNACGDNRHSDCLGKTFDHICTCIHHVLEARIVSLEEQLKTKKITLKAKKVLDPNFIWISSDGRKNYIPDMATPHLVNTLNWIERTVKEFLDKPVKVKEVKDLENTTTLNTVRVNRLSDAIDRLKSRMNAVIEDDFEDHELLWFNAAYPQYPVLREEALKRKCHLDNQGVWVF